MSLNRPPRILLLIPHLGGGGAEQVTALLARGLAHHRYEVHLGLVTQADGGADSLPPGMHLHALGATRVRAGVLRLIRLIRRLKPDLILSGMAHLNFLVLLLRPFFPPETRVLVRQNGTVSASLASGELPSYTRLLYRLLYRRADHVICQTPAMADDLAAELKLSRHRLAVLLNPVDVDAIRATVLNTSSQVLNSPRSWTDSNSQESSSTGQHLLAVGRLSREKGFDLLLQALAVVRERFPNADLTIAGAGSQEAALKHLASDLGLGAAVRFAGYVTQPAAYFTGATLFVLSSRHEGMPNALLEAAAGGLPIVAMPSSQGVVDLLDGQPGVWLAAEISAPALAASLLAALKSLQPDERFTHTWIEEFRLERVLEAYECLIDAALREKKQSIFP
jgi:glycosyltransferase involved in cell wall biosynthesis